MREKNSKNSSNGKKKSTSNSTRKKKVSPKIDETLEVSNDKVKVVRAKVDSIKNIYDPSVEKESASDVVVEVVGTSSEKGKENALEKGASSKEFSPSKEVALYEPDKVSDPLTVYIREINRYDLLSIEQEQALTKALEETGDIEIARKLVLANLRLVVKIAMEYRSAHQNVMDLIQEGNIGLMKAVSKYDRSKGAKLSYYASWWIRSYILKFILDNFRLIKIGTTNEQKKLFYNLMKEKNRLLSMGIDPDTKTLSENLGVSEKAVVVMDQRLSDQGGEVSIDKPLFDDSEKGTLGDNLVDTKYDGGLENIVAASQEVDLLKENLGGFMETLKPRDLEIFKKRLLEEVPPSLQTLADSYGVSRERIRQIEERLLKNLRVYMSKFIR
ncbi:MAG: RNA polymerase subunit sigma-70 [Halobacteriovoraceae bacterium]|nr:RNA polymerase subunit sigma-70 [Halobacteriovoraceae bacterium]